MSKASTTPTTLPPRHGGYRAANDSGKYVAKPTGKGLPKPPSGKGGGSKVRNG